MEWGGCGRRSSEERVTCAGWSGDGHADGTLARDWPSPRLPPSVAFPSPTRCAARLFERRRKVPRDERLAERLRIVPDVAMFSLISEVFAHRHITTATFFYNLLSIVICPNISYSPSHLRLH